MMKAVMKTNTFTIFFNSIYSYNMHSACSPLEPRSETFFPRIECNSSASLRICAPNTLSHIPRHLFTFVNMLHIFFHSDGAFQITHLVAIFVKFGVWPRANAAIVVAKSRIRTNATRVDNELPSSKAVGIIRFRILLSIHGDDSVIIDDSFARNEFSGGKQTVLWMSGMARVGDALLDSVFARRVLGVFDGRFFHCWEGATSEQRGRDGRGEFQDVCVPYEEKDERNDGDAASSSLLGISGVLR